MKTLKLAVYWQTNSMSLFLFEKSQGLKQTAILPGASIKEFVGNYKPSQTILIIPRSEVLQKEMAINGVGGLREDLEVKIAQLLPYSPKEMAFSLAVDTSKGLLYAIPEQKINAVLNTLTRSGIGVDEVVSEDQALFWFFNDKAASGPILVIDQTAERTLFLAFKENTILLSRVYPSEEELKNILSEISFSLFESGVKPVKVFVSGSVDVEEVQRALEIPVEKISPETVGGTVLSPILSGARRWGMYPAISLLPSAQKLKNRDQKNKKLLVESVAAMGLFLLSFVFLAGSHIFFMKQKIAMIEKSTAKLAPMVAEVRQMTSSLDSLHEAERSKVQLLSLIQQLAERVPASVRLKELLIEEKSIVFQGESPSHALLTETTQVFEKIEGVKEAKLEHARLRKRLNQDFFDFEVTARWKS